ncbi:hypothetical protein GRS96_15425 [Rathayibacter sp. VKM Ac-2803]|uniref:hypothetical protein n=1 Tax=Rathayibacter sp. VKM Ac-2803 TaxID=2609256 RepID=UPI001358DDA5|nr:hypothetical protein [Rathayibacter sp. VKM Ac-2803]MWV50664.1 hypothetical protein [Rathayibacter sp. VKM Ac-2803]
MGRRGLALSGSGAVVLLVLAGCSGAVPDDSVRHEPLSSAQIEALGEQERESGHDEQAESLEDGVVTFEEYDASFTRYAECLTGKGFTVEGPQVSPVDGVRYESSTDIGTRERSAALADIDECQARYSTSVAQAYELSRPQVMDPPLATAAGECLTGRGLSVTGEEANVVDFVESVGEAEDDVVMDCVLDEATRLYPEMPALSVGY